MKIPSGSGQLTLVAFFGDKQQQYPELWQVIAELQDAIATILGAGIFTRYDERRVHGTVVGLEGFRTGEDLWNANCYEKIRMRSRMNLSGLFDFLLADNSILPVTVKVGGFKENMAYPFTSRGQSPYVRSFSIQGDIAVAMGWPMHGRFYTSGIDALRRSANEFNVLHKYHDSWSAYDNDFFFVLGTVKKGTNQNMLEACQNQIREILSCKDVPLIQISKDQLNVVAYPEGDTTFKNAEAGTLAEARQQIEDLVRFYPERSC